MEHYMQTFKLTSLLGLTALLIACSSTPDWSSYSPTEAAALQAMGLSTSDANYYKDMGYNSETIQRWYDAGLRDRQTITSWADAGFIPAEAGEWVSAQFSLKEAQKWKGSKFSAAEAKDWITKGFDLRDAEKLRKRGLDAN
jgi:hypothetical protein